MQDQQRRYKERGQRVDQFMVASVDNFAPGSKGAEQHAVLKDILFEVDELDAGRAASKRKRKQGTEGREQTRTKLQRMLRLATDTGETAALDHPELKGLFAPPEKDYNDTALLAAVRSVADAAVPHLAKLAAYGLPGSFFNEMRATADEFGSHVATQTAAAGEGASNVAALKDAFRRLNETVERLDTIVTNTYRDDPVKLAAWKSAVRLERAPRHTDDD
ncbi:MAG TPA: hypothetical protein VNZ44_04175, partial [Pyrinomonadaceae bacterium]|nr:hypothetical protein [Pyrinomonadaceae bacterium]